jgi:hypothetical protein
MNVSDRAATAQRHNQYHITRSLEKQVSQVAKKEDTRIFSYQQDSSLDPALFGSAKRKACRSFDLQAS